MTFAHLLQNEKCDVRKSNYIALLILQEIVNLLNNKAWGTFVLP